MNDIDILIIGIFICIQLIRNLFKDDFMQMWFSVGSWGLVLAFVFLKVATFLFSGVNF